MTGTKNRTTRRRGPFGPRSRPFRPLSPTLMVVPTSFLLSHDVNSHSINLIVGLLDYYMEATLRSYLILVLFGTPPYFLGL